MPQHSSAVSDEYANRTPCIKHSRVYAGEARGSMRHNTYSSCEFTDRNFRCRYSHTAFNTKRVVELGRKNDALLGSVIVKLEYGYGFERYGAYEGPDSGWDVTVDGRDLARGRRRNLPKSLLLAELSAGITSKGAPDHQYEKKQSMCMDRQKSAGCPRGVNCKYDHDIVDSTRLESLATAFSDGNPGYDTRDFLALECHISGTDGDAVVWKIMMKPDAFRGVKANDPLKAKIPANQIVFDGNDLLDILNRLEDFVGLKK
ncbi:hypothetical protein Moror_6055 [Moniliophthora roreri MCA 2997]|uniref:C3H1-type domain-containing protein n=1 Tax=Moniliophthora roreri (strain MCA 2997) TaxID=1381753 RepID=V2WNI5_MONRO|nr:hypothetical protein Moror_6055 [Moniliophthora roreri MCA 2997]KAI3612825.1 hypothetical protein WG66_005254 [Moniliophthora roreri]